MKSISSLFLLCFVLLVSQETSAQIQPSKGSISLIVKKALWKKDMKKQGFRILDEGGLYLNKGEILNTDYRTYYKGKKYKFIGIADDCSSCSLSVKFGQQGEIPENLPERKSFITRYPKGKVTVITNGASVQNNMKGYFLLFNNSGPRRYTYGMLFVKD